MEKKKLSKMPWTDNGGARFGEVVRSWVSTSKRSRLRLVIVNGHQTVRPIEPQQPRKPEQRGTREKGKSYGQGGMHNLERAT